ncbi:MAG: [protein-PII] uridylyltransferase [Desulfococcaceae bacterium]
MAEAAKKIYESPMKNLCLKRKQMAEDLLAGNAPDFNQQNTQILDEYFHECYQQSAVGMQMAFERKPYALVALGGYGRQEQCLHSDVDILILFEHKIPNQAEELVREMVYPLWDIGMEVGHATRSAENCISLAMENIEVLTAMLDARFICGMSVLYSDLMGRLREEIHKGRSDRVIAQIITRNRERHEHFGDSSFLLEPNLKEGRGGLRDYHTLLWIARIKNDLRQPRDLEYSGCFSYNEYRTLTKSLAFIWEVRNRLHYLSGKKCDQLYFRHQEKLAREMNFRKKNGQQPVERFLGELHRHMDFLKEQERIRVYELENETVRRGRRRKSETPQVQGLENRNGMLAFVSSEKVHECPQLLIQIFEESARMKIPLNAEAIRLVKEFQHRVDDKFRTSAFVRQSFEAILLTPVPRFNVLETMLTTGFLVNYIPQFDEISNRIQYDEYHLYPVDRHLLRTVRTIKQFCTEEDSCRKETCCRLYTELADPKLLLWAALLHDIGKGTPGGNHSEKGAVMAGAILREKGYGDKDTETVCFLIREHLFLINIATRRDLQDEETAIFCARRIQDTERLKMLYLLTIADSAATGPKAWNEWTASLLEYLFLNVLNILEKGELASGAAMDTAERKKADVLNTAADEKERERTEKIFNIMSPRYLLATSAPDIAEHIGLFRSLGNANFVWKISGVPGSETRTVTICAKDCPGLFSKIAGTLTLNGINILAAQIYTWRNNIALDVFEVMPPKDEFFEQQKWEHAESDLESALLGQLDLESALAERLEVYGFPSPKTWQKPDEIAVDNSSSGFFTIVEVYTYDFPGLLFCITDALFKCRLDIWVAKIATKIDQVVDVFYVRDFDGQKADSPQQVAAIRSAIEKVLPRRGQVNTDNW